MLDFIGYMTFSTFEYCAIIFFFLSIFKTNIKRYKKEFILTAVSVTLISYFITIIDQRFTSLTAILLILSFRFMFHMKPIRSIVVVIGGAAIYGGLQWVILYVASHNGYITMQDMNSAFSVKTYVMQTLTSTIAITFSIYTRVVNGGFGFSLRSKKKPYRVFLYTTIISFILSVSCLLAFTYSLKGALFNASGVMFIVSSAVIFFFSYKEDHAEYS
jgi:hypothetical protein